MFLKRRMAEAQKANPAFSGRAFAKKFGIAHGFLNEVLSGKKNLSGEMALRFANKLDLTVRETEEFCTLVQLESTRDPELKKLIIQKLRSARSDIEVPTDLSVEVFTAIADWYHVAIRNLVELEGFEFTPKSIAKKLDITVLEAEIALDRLLKLELIEENKESSTGYSRSEPHSMVKSKAPSAALRKFHKQMLNKAIESLETQTNDEKLVASHTLAVSDEAFIEADKLVDEFLERFAALNRVKGKKTKVYHLGIQFFNVTHERKK